MTFGREKRRLLAVLALLAPLPLPFNEILEWPALALYVVAVGYFLLRTRQRPGEWLPTWVVNLVGLAYMPFFAFDLMVLGRARLVVPVVHLLLFAVAAKLYSLRVERDKWHVLMAVFFLFLAAMATSVHPTIVLYLLLFMVLTLLALTRFALMQTLAGFGRDDPSMAVVPLGGFLAISTVIILLVAVPLFAVLPRVHAPYIMGRGAGTGTPIEAAGFTDQVTLDSIGLSRSNRSVVMRLNYDGGKPSGTEMRFKVGTHNYYQDGVWRRSSQRGAVLYRQGVRFDLSPDSASARPERWVEIWLRQLAGSRLAVPVEAVALESLVPAIMLTPAGTVSLPGYSAGVVQYRAGLGAEPVIFSAPPGLEPGQEPTLDTGGLSPKIEALAADVASQADAAGDPRLTAEAFQRYLSTEFEYTLDFLGRAGERPLEDFLFRFKSGHCEYFASAMVLMLRAEGVPARLVTGFLGGEYNPIEDYYIVRQLNSHAWVEAYLDGSWRSFDPTPASGRPVGPREGLGNLLTQAWDYLEFRWDRYVLTYGLSDQMQFFLGLREGWRNVWSLLSKIGKKGPRSEDGDAPAPVAGEVEAEPAPASPWAHGWALGGVGLALILAAFFLWRRRAAGPEGHNAYQLLRRRLQRAGLTLEPSLPPLAVARIVERRYPAAALAASDVVELYLRESFGGVALGERQLEALHQASAQMATALRRGDERATSG